MMFLSYLGAIALGLYTSDPTATVASATFGVFGASAFSFGVQAYQYLIG